MSAYHNGKNLRAISFHCLAFICVGISAPRIKGNPLKYDYTHSEAPSEYECSNDYLNAIYDDLESGGWNESLEGGNIMGGVKMNYDEGSDKAHQHSCLDLDNGCSELVELGVCDTSPEIMKEICAKSCQFCLDINFDKGVTQEINGSSAEKLRTIESIRQSNIYIQSSVLSYPKQAQQACRDTHRLCAFWAGQSECDKLYSHFLADHCPLSCRRCEITGEMNVKQNVTGFDREIELTQNVMRQSHEYLVKIYNETTPQHLEAILEKCVNRYPLCAFWASINECDGNSVFMDKNCALACQSCTI